jgi:hypothetical protein
LSLIDPSRTTPRDLLIVGLVLVAAIWIWHEFVLTPGRLNDQLCERVDVLEMDKMSEEARGALDEMSRICRERRPIIEGP